MTIVQLVPALPRKRTLIVGTALPVLAVLAVLAIVASTTVADTPVGAPRTFTAPPTGGSGVAAGPPDPAETVSSESPRGPAATKPTGYSTTAAEPPADAATSPPGLPAASRTPDASPPLAGRPQTGAIRTADCTEETGPSHPAWPVPYGDGGWGHSEAVEEHELREDGELLGGFKMVRANRPDLTYYWTSGWTGVHPGDTETWLVLDWREKDGTARSSCRRRLDGTGYWHDTIAVPRFVDGKFIEYQACQEIYGRAVTCTDWW